LSTATVTGKVANPNATNGYVGMLNIQCFKYSAITFFNDGVLTDVAGNNFAGIDNSSAWTFSAASLSTTVALMTILPVPLAMASLNVATRLLFGAIASTVFTVIVGAAVLIPVSCLLRQ
jgi:hypothetical protein